MLLGLPEGDRIDSATGYDKSFARHNSARINKLMHDAGVVHIDTEKFDDCPGLDNFESNETYTDALCASEPDDIIRICKHILHTRKEPS